MRRAAVGQEKDAVGNESPVFEPARQHDDEAKASSSPPFDRIGASRRLLSYYVHSNEPSAEMPHQQNNQSSAGTSSLFGLL
jgi:hypothetical protein